MQREYKVIAEWECDKVMMVTVMTPGGCSVIEQKEWIRIYNSLHPENWNRQCKTVA